MPNASLAEIYFITAMMILILIVCGVALYFFFKTYRQEMREKEKRRARKAAEKAQSENASKEKAQF